MQHSFDTSIAQKFGVNVAIFLNNMVYWIQKNIANNKHFHDGAYWTYNSVESYTIIFPYLSAKQIRKVLSDCVKFDLIKIGNYNDTKYDRTQWYSLTDNAAKLLNISILPKGQMHCDKRANRFVQKGEPIPDIKPDIKNIEREKLSLSDYEKRNYDFTEDELIAASELGIVNPAMVFEKFKTYLKSKSKKYFTRHGFKLWLIRESEYIKNKKHSSVNSNIQYNTEPRSTIKEWKEGHPDYDRVHASSLKTQNIECF